MSSQARVVGLYIATAAGATMQPCAAIEVVPGLGVVGDRYANRRGYWSGWPDQELTLVESEVGEALDMDPSLLRRNAVTRGLRLDELIGIRFHLGTATILGVRRCDPCQYLDTLTRPGLARDLASHGGLRARILQGGHIAVGDAIRVVVGGA